MKPTFSAALLSVGLTACVEAEPVSGGTGTSAEEPSDAPITTTTFGGGQTGQSGTEVTCGDLYPTVEEYWDVDEVTSLGVSAREAMATFEVASATLTFNDGVQTRVSLELALADDATVVRVFHSDRYEDCRKVLTVRNAVHLRTDDGQLDGVLINNDAVQFWADGAASIYQEFPSLLLDTAAWGNDSESFWLDADVDGASTSGSLRYRVGGNGGSGTTTTTSGYRSAFADIATW